MHWIRNVGVTATLLLVGAWMLPQTAQAADELRVRLSEADLNQMEQDERWSLMDAQQHAERGNFRAAAIGYQMFIQQHPESLFWSYALYCEGYYHYRADRLNTAISRLQELVDLAPDAPEVPEALLLMARAQLQAGMTSESLATAQQIIADHQRSTAYEAARVVADNCIRLIGEQRGQDEDQVRAARIRNLAPLAENIQINQFNAGWLDEGLDRLRDLVFAAGDLDEAVALARGLANAQGNDRAINLERMQQDIYQRVMRAAWTHGRDNLATEVAQEAWPNVRDRYIQVNRRRFDWIRWAHGNTDTVAEARGMSEQELESWLEETLEEMIAHAQGVLDEGVSRRHRGDILNLTMDMLFYLQRPQQAFDLYVAVTGGQMNQRSAISMFERLVRAGMDPLDARAQVVTRVPEGRERWLTEFNLTRWEATSRDLPESRRIAAANQVILMAQSQEEEDPEHVVEWIGYQAEMQDDVLEDYEAAIVSYTRMNQPPRTDFSIARCYERMGQWTQAIAKYNEIYAMNMNNQHGSQALMSIGQIYHRRLDDRASAIRVLRQVCDEFPNTRHYSEAHRYLQNELGVIVTTSERD